MILTPCLIHKSRNVFKCFQVFFKTPFHFYGVGVKYVPLLCLEIYVHLGHHNFQLMVYNGSAQHSQIVGLGLVITSSYTCLFILGIPLPPWSLPYKQKENNLRK
jgi:hypothetical protein